MSKYLNRGGVDFAHPSDKSGLIESVTAATFRCFSSQEHFSPVVLLIRPSDNRDGRGDPAVRLGKPRTHTYIHAHARTLSRSRTRS
ncbi:hypothetical protein Baya_8262 [Bagarius yarrelli]|uniref:Uncharacterized protein n=1 Tax=Bagarius yarrelli TaxID=175774 RepID=A0A556U3N7_BAGYA|nr:hypothetical protein Baya_8262 [Bagarius yarrelli]